MDEKITLPEKFISIARAKELLYGNVPQASAEEIELLEAIGRITARDIYAPYGMPSFRKSPFDGYCLKSKNSSGASMASPVLLSVAGTLKAGTALGEISGDCYKIMTGTEVPAIYDCVIKKEDTDCGEFEVKLFLELIPGQNIINLGEDVNQGDLIMAKGKKITPGAIAMLSSLGLNTISVYKKPKIALITTGDEVIEPGVPLIPGKVYNSNRYALMAYLKELGVEADYLGNAPDDPDQLSHFISRGLKDYNLVLTTGGVSVGDFDYLGRVYETLGIEKLFWAVQMKPGTPVLAGRFKDTLLISLPGSPAASLIAFEVLVSPVIRKMKGLLHYEKKVHHGIMVDDFNKASDLPRFLRVIVEKDQGEYRVRLSGKQNASVLHSMVEYNALALVKTLNERIKKGDSISFSFNQEEEI